MEVQGLLAQLASLGAQQQAALSAIAAKQQPTRTAAAARQPIAGAFQPGPSSLVFVGWGVDINVAVGNSAMQAHLYCSGWKVCMLAFFAFVASCMCLISSPS